MTCWMIKKSNGFTEVELLRISESTRAYPYLVLSLQASARSMISGNMMSALTTEKAFLNNFNNVINPQGVMTLKGAKILPPGTIIVHKTLPLGQKGESKAPLPGHKIREFHKYIYEL